MLSTCHLKAVGSFRTGMGLASAEVNRRGDMRGELTWSTPSLQVRMGLAPMIKIQTGAISFT